MSHLYKTYHSDVFDESVFITHEYSDVDGNPLLYGHVAGTPIDEYIIFRPSELRYQPVGKIVPNRVDTN